jgi:hypothetical protein
VKPIEKKENLELIARNGRNILAMGETHRKENIELIAQNGRNPGAMGEAHRIKVY